MVALLAEPVEMSGRKKGKSLLPVYSPLLPAPTYGMWECLEVPLEDVCGASVIAMGKPSQILQRLDFFTVLLVNNLCCYSLWFFPAGRTGWCHRYFHSY